MAQRASTARPGKSAPTAVTAGTSKRATPKRAAKSAAAADGPRPTLRILETRVLRGPELLGP